MSKFSFTLFVLLNSCTCWWGCGSPQKPAGCTAADEAVIDGWYQAELVQKCSAYAPTKTPETSCPYFKGIETEYKKKSEEWYLRCHP